jgi:hypothetical protein
MLCRWLLCCSQKRIHWHNKSWCAKATLRSMCLRKRFLCKLQNSVAFT